MSKDTTPDTQWGRPPRTGGFIRFMADKRDRALLVVYGKGPFTAEMKPGKFLTKYPQNNYFTASLTLQQMARLRDSLTDFLVQAEVEAQSKKPNTVFLKSLPLSKIPVIKAVRNFTRMNLKEAVDTVNSVPVRISLANPQDTLGLTQALKDLGAEVE